MKRERVLMIEAPDAVAKVDFLSGRYRVTVTLAVEKNQLYVSAMADNEPECTIIADEVFEIPKCPRK